LYADNTQSYSNSPESSSQNSNSKSSSYFTSSTDQTTPKAGSQSTTSDNKLHYSYTMQIEDLPQSKQVSGDNDKSKQRKRPLLDEEDINITLPNANEKKKKLKDSSKETEGKLVLNFLNCRCS
jgi:hypothetical protein